MSKQDAIGSTNSGNPSDFAEEPEVIVGKLCFVNYFLIIVALLFIPGAVWIPIMHEHFYAYLMLSAFVLVFEVIARPFSYYGVSSTGFTEYRHGKKRRSIPWSSVIQVGKQLDGLGRGAVAGVIITLDGAHKYTKTHTISSFRYYLIWRPRVLYIYDAPKALPVIERFYGKADYVCKDDLQD